MRRDEVEKLSSVIRENTERLSLDDLAAKGRRYVRVVSSKKVLHLIQAIVDDAIERESANGNGRDRGRIVEEAQGKINRVLKIQMEQEAEIERLRSELNARDQVINELRNGSAPVQIASLRSELAQVKELIGGMSAQSSGMDEDTLSRLLEQIESRDALQTSEFQKTLNETMEQTLGEVTRSIKSATASPIEVSGEATDVLVSRIFDEQDEMTTNLDSLKVDERSSKRSISSNLARLRQAQLAGKDTDTDTGGE